MIYYLTSDGAGDFDEAVSLVGDADLQTKLHFTQTQKDIDTMVKYDKATLVSKAQEFINWISGEINNELDSEAINDQIDSYLTKKTGYTVGNGCPEWFVTNYLKPMSFIAMSTLFKKMDNNGIAYVTENCDAAKINLVLGPKYNESVFNGMSEDGE